MDFAFSYCPQRWKLENHAACLSTAMCAVVRKAELFRRSAANTQLQAAQCEYTEIRAELSEAQYRLQSHRAEHGC